MAALVNSKPLLREFFSSIKIINIAKVCSLSVYLFLDNRPATDLTIRIPCLAHMLEILDGNMKSVWS